MNPTLPVERAVPVPIVHVTKSSEGTEALARETARSLTLRETICLEGTLGAGKSVFARALIRALCDDPDMSVPSPSYTLANVYSGPDQQEIWHADLYRIADPDEILEIGLNDAVGEALLIVEWAQNWPDRPQNSIVVRIAIEDDETRRIEITRPDAVSEHRS